MAKDFQHGGLFAPSIWFRLCQLQKSILIWLIIGHFASSLLIVSKGKSNSTLESSNYTNNTMHPILEDSLSHFLLKNNRRNIATILNGGVANSSWPFLNCSEDVFSPNLKRIQVPIIINAWIRSPKGKVKMADQVKLHGILLMPQTNSDAYNWRTAPVLSKSTQEVIHRTIARIHEGHRTKTKISIGHDTTAAPFLENVIPTISTASRKYFRQPRSAVNDGHAYNDRLESTDVPIVELNFFDTALQNILPENFTIKTTRGLKDANIQKNNHITTAFVPDTLASQLLRKQIPCLPDRFPYKVNGISSGTGVSGQNLNNGASSEQLSWSIYQKHDSVGGNFPDPRFVKLKSKKKKKKKKKKDKHSSEEYGNYGNWDGGYGGHNGYGGWQQAPSSGSGWGNHGWESSAHEFAGWVGGSEGLLNSGNGYYEFEFLPAQLFQKLINVFGLLAILGGPLMIILLTVLLLFSGPSKAAPAYIFNGRSSTVGSSYNAFHRRIGLFSYDDNTKFETGSS